MKFVNEGTQEIEPETKSEDTTSEETDKNEVKTWLLQNYSRNRQEMSAIER